MQLSNTTCKSIVALINFAAVNCVAAFVNGSAANIAQRSRLVWAVSKIFDLQVESIKVEASVLKLEFFVQALAN